MYNSHRPKEGVGKAAFDVIAHIALLPFLILCFIAPGTMAVRGDQGAPKIVICSGYGPVEVIVAGDGSFKVPNATSGNEDKATNLCDWAFHNQPAAHITASIEPQIVRSSSPLSIFAAISEHASRIAVLCPSTRGPPSQAFI